jgi:signal peptidase II
MQKWFIPGTLALAALLADFCSKIWANTNLQYGQQQQFLPGLLHLTLTRNSGSAFGLGKGHSTLMAVLASAIILTIIAWTVKRERSDSPLNGLERSGVAIIIGGAIGNLIDRLMHGEVTDFLDFSFIDFPVFNVADALIDIGAALVIIGALMLNQRNDAAEDAGEKPVEKNV